MIKTSEKPEQKHTTSPSIPPATGFPQPKIISTMPVGDTDYVLQVEDLEELQARLINESGKKMNLRFFRDITAQEFQASVTSTTQIMQQQNITNSNFYALAEQSHHAYTLRIPLTSIDSNIGSGISGRTNPHLLKNPYLPLLYKNTNNTISNVSSDHSTEEQQNTHSCREL